MYVRLVWNLLCSLGWPQTHNAYFSLEGSRITGMFHCTWPGLDLNLREQTPGSYICETQYFSTGLQLSPFLCFVLRQVVIKYLLWP